MVNRAATQSRIVQQIGSVFSKIPGAVTAYDAGNRRGVRVGPAVRLRDEWGRQDGMNEQKSVKRKTKKIPVHKVEANWEGQILRESIQVLVEPPNVGGQCRYTTLPEDRSKWKEHRWLVELQMLGDVSIPIRLDIAGDVVLGVADDETYCPDLDLSAYGADQKGVSRHHVLIRPTQRHLYLIDLNSINGTWVNGVSVSSITAQQVRNQDVITLGGLSFVIGILKVPSD
jgi:hypothetical protein